MSSQMLPKALAPAPVKPYRRFVVPLMHRRFTNAASLSLVVCFLCQLLMGDYTSFWQAIGTSAVRTSLLFISILAIYVLRMGNIHVGRRTSISQALNIYSSIFSTYAASCLLWYLLSAWIFAETYIWSSSTSADLGIIDPGKTYERPRLNERPIFLRFLFLFLGAAQALVHLVDDHDRIPFPTKKPILEPTALTKATQRPFTAPVHKIQQEHVHMLTRAFRITFLTTLLGPFFYWLFIRQHAWSWAFWAAKLVFALPKSSSKPPVFPPGLPGLTARFLLHGFLLALAWEVANIVFDACLAQEPIKQGRLLTDESPDPNGTLVSGLKTTRSIPRTFAFWELNLISQTFGLRRELIYKDIDRAGGSAWSQILTICLGEVHAIVRRIQDENMSSAPTNSAQTSGGALLNLPKLGTGPRDENIFTKPKHVPFSEIRGQSPNNKFVEASTAKLIDYAAKQTHVAPALNKGNVDSFAKSVAVNILHTSVGIPFRQTLARHASVVILGRPTSNDSTILDAITAISKLIVHSKKEDNFGTVYRDVPNIIRIFTSTYNSIESFLQTTPVHWTDITFEADDRKVPDIQPVLEALQDALRDIVNEFGEFSDSMGLSSYELRMAKEIVAKSGAGEDVRQIRA